MQTHKRTIFTTADTKLAVNNAAGEAWKCTLTGYALVWNVLSSDRGGYVVRLLPDSATFTPRVLAFWNHDSRDTIGSTSNGTLRLTTDQYGVKVEIDLPDTTAGRDLAVLVERGDIVGMSFGMTDTPEGERVTENGQAILNASRYVVDEVTVTAIPAFTQSSIAVKPQAVYAALNRQRLQMQRLQFASCRLPGQTRPPAVV